MKRHILIVDDDDKIRILLGEYLRKQGFLVFFAANTYECERVIEYFKIDLIILDLMMPKETGIEFLKRYNTAIPKIMLSALSDVDDRITGLQSGADDYIGKPFEPKELLLRMERILERTCNNKLALGKNEFDVNTNVLTNKNGDNIHLTSLERSLLRYLIDNKGSVVSRELLMEKLGQKNERYIDLCIARLRAKIEISAKSPKLLQTVRNKGYVLYTE